MGQCEIVWVMKMKYVKLKRINMSKKYNFRNLITLKCLWCSKLCLEILMFSVKFSMKIAKSLNVLC